MYAVIKTGGKQYRVTQGDILRVEKLDAEAGDVVTFDQVLMIGGEGNPLVGAPGVDGASVTAEVLDERKDKKVIVFKKRRRQNYRRKRGHRQWITVISIAEILKPGVKSALGGKKKAARPAEEAAVETAPAKPAKAAAGADDLTQLNGVGPAFARKLADAGVTTFAQVAAWIEADLERLDGEFAGLKAKAESGEWIARAKELAGA
ncbi:MAG: 50S ribosomal protein L21 [Alphaproteobacteria bacterium]|nr:50S ribosomal protein L21 [Alphaproteobacteria bacterium]